MTEKRAYKQRIGVKNPNYPDTTGRVQTNHLEEIQHYIESRGEYPLSPTVEAIRTRLEAMWKARTATAHTFKTRAQILKEHTTDFGIDEKQSRTDWEDCITIYRNYTNIDANTELYISLLRYDELINEAREMGKIEAALQAMKSRAEIVGKLQPDPNKPDYNKQAPRVTALVLDDFTRILFEKARQKMGDPEFYQAFLKLVLDIENPLEFDFNAFLEAETIDFETV
jgi:hypothetical protein